MLAAVHWRNIFQQLGCALQLTIGRVVAEFEKRPARTAA